MKHSKLLVAAALVATLGLPACMSGPKQFTRSIDDWDQEMYVQTPWMNSILWIVPMFPVFKGLAFIGDTLGSNPIYFWFDDAWDNQGTAFKRAQTKPTDGSLDSVIVDGGRLWDKK